MSILFDLLRYTLDQLDQMGGFTEVRLLHPRVVELHNNIELSEEEKMEAEFCKQEDVGLMRCKSKHSAAELETAGFVKHGAWYVYVMEVVQQWAWYSGNAYSMIVEVTHWSEEAGNQLNSPDEKLEELKEKLIKAIVAPHFSVYRNQRELFNQ